MKPLSDAQRRYIEDLRRELGITSTEMPAKSRDGSRLIEQLLRHRGTNQREADRTQLSPSEEVRRSIDAVASRLGIEVDVPDTAPEARFVLDDLYHRERKARRVADGSLG